MPRPTSPPAFLIACWGVPMADPNVRSPLDCPFIVLRGGRGSQETWDGHLPNLVHKEQLYKCLFPPVVEDGPRKLFSLEHIYGAPAVTGLERDADGKPVTLKEKWWRWHLGGAGGLSG